MKVAESAGSPPRSLLALACAVAVLDSIFIAALAPLLPYYAELLGIGSGAAGVLSASYSVGLLVGALPAGILTVRLGQRAVLVLALAVLAVSSIVFGLADTFFLLLAARTLEGVASAFAWTAMLGWLVAVTREQRARLFGLVFGAAFAGFTLGPVLGAIATGVGPELAFVSVGIISAALGVWALTFRAPPRSVGRPFRAYSRLASQPAVRYALWLQALPGILIGATSVAASLRLAELGATPAAIAAAFLAASALQGVASPLVGRWVDRSGPLHSIRVGLLGAAAATAAMALPDDSVALALLLIASWIPFTIILVPATAVLTTAVEQAEEDPSLGFALMNLAFAPGAIVGAVAAGALRDAAGDGAALLAVSAICLATLLAPARAVDRMQPAPERPEL